MTDKENILEVKYCGLNETFKFQKLEVSNNCFVKGWKDVIDVWDDKLKSEIEKYMPTLVQDGINRAPSGAIQDPAGSAIGSPRLLGGGASGAIYQTFDLEPIPNIMETAAIFNSTSDPNGKRVLHTHSPILSGEPENPKDFMEVIRTLANTYLNAMIAFLLRSKHLGEHGKLLNLVPVSASIFGGRYRCLDLGTGHMDPSLTLVSIALAIGMLINNEFPVPNLKLYFYEREVYERAMDYLSA